MKNQRELPPSTVTVRNGRVVRIQKWVLWNGVPWPTITIERGRDDMFSSSIDDPEHGGGSYHGSLEYALAGLHPKIQLQFTEVFELTDPTPEDIHRAGFPGYQLVEG